MASILDRYGIKEVADVTFYEIDASTGAAGKPVLYLDTLKVSTIEQTAETSDARGGKGNPKLISWDYGKEITVSLEDALFSAKSMAIMFGNGVASTPTAGKVQRVAVARKGSDTANTYVSIDLKDPNGGAVRTKVWFGTTVPAGQEGKVFTAANPKISRLTDADGDPSKDYISATDSTYATADECNTFIDGLTEGAKFFVTYDLDVTKTEVVISGDSFPGTYYVTGDTYARSDVSGKDQFFQFIIPKAKVTSENTITLEAEGDPSVFNMNLTVLRPDSGEMMKLVQYELV
jgi:hypothetical protein